MNLLGVVGAGLMREAEETYLGHRPPLDRWIMVAPAKAVNVMLRVSSALFPKIPHAFFTAAFVEIQAGLGIGQNRVLNGGAELEGTTA
jgi:hypothetical protein